MKEMTWIVLKNHIYLANYDSHINLFISIEFIEEVFSKLFKIFAYYLRD